MSNKAVRLDDYLQHMRDATERVLRYTCAKSQFDFTADEQLQDAVIRNIEIIGEAARNISLHAPDFARENAQIPWPALYAMRNRLSHGYWAIDLTIVWQVIQRDLPELKIQLDRLESSNEWPRRINS